MTTATEIAQALIRIPSVNPDGHPGTPATGEEACAAWIADFLKSFGAEAELRHVFPGRPNVVGRLPTGDSTKPRILLAPHTDTVSIVGMTIPPFSGEVRDGRLLGRGASDTKGPMAAMLWALREIAPRARELPYELWFAGLAGEEAGQHGAKALAAQEKFDFVIAGEPTGLNVVYTHKGSNWTRLRTRGRAVHASRPAEGDNAIYKMADAIDCIRTGLTGELAKVSDPVLGPPTVSVGTISGGSKTNIVPDICEASVDMRTIPGQDVTLLERMLRERVPGIEIETTGSLPLRTDPAHPLIAKLCECGAQRVGAPWFCDAAVFAAQGCPSVAVGPGSIAQAHTADEFIAVDDLERGAEFFLNFLELLLVSHP